MGNFCATDRDSKRGVKNKLEYVQRVYKEENQEHVFEFFDELTDEQKDNLVQQLFDIDPRVTNNLYRDLVLENKIEHENSEVTLERISDDLVINTQTMDQEERLKLQE